MANHTLGFVARCDAFASAFKGWVEQLQQLRKQDRTGAMDARPPLNASTGAPGSGKTRFLDELTNSAHLARLAQDLSICPADFASWFRTGNVLVVNITFNGDMGKDKDEENMTQMVTSRLLYRYVAKNRR